MVSGVELYYSRYRRRERPELFNERLDRLPESTLARADLPLVSLESGAKPERA